MRKSIIPTSTNKDQVMIQSLLRNALTVSENGKRVVAHTMISVFASVCYPSMEIRKGISVALDKIAKGSVGINDIENAIKSHL